MKVLHVDTQNKQVEVLSHETGERYHESYDALIISPRLDATSAANSRYGVGGHLFTLWTVPDAIKSMSLLKKKFPREPSSSAEDLSALKWWKT